MIDDILAFSRSGTAELKPVPVDMAELVHRTLAEELAPVLAERASAIDIGDLPVAHGDKAMLQRVWMNLLDNALKIRLAQARRADRGRRARRRRRDRLLCARQRRRL